MKLSKHQLSLLCVILKGRIVELKETKDLEKDLLMKNAIEELESLLTTIQEELK